MIGHHVAQRTRRFVIATTLFDADFLSSGDLHAVDVAAIPNRLEDAVAEPENQNVLDSLFAEIVIDPVNLVFLENLLNLSIEFAGRFKIATERLLDHDASPVF